MKHLILLPFLLLLGCSLYAQSPGSTTIEMQGDDLMIKDFPRFRAALNGGWSTRLAKVSSSLDEEFADYIKELKSGYNYSLDLTYFYSAKSGFGLKYAAYQSKGSLENYFVSIDTVVVDAHVSDDITITFIGPFYSSRHMFKNHKSSLLANIGFGYVGYSDKTVFVSPYKITGSTAGFSFDIGYDMGISKNLALGIQLSYSNGVLRKYKLSDETQTRTIELDEDHYESLARIDLSVGIRFTK